MDNLHADTHLLLTNPEKLLLANNNANNANGNNNANNSSNGTSSSNQSPSHQLQHLNLNNNNNNSQRANRVQTGPNSVTIMPSMLHSSPGHNNVAATTTEIEFPVDSVAYKNRTSPDSGGQLVQSTTTTECVPSPGTPTGNNSPPTLLQGHSLTKNNLLRQSNYSQLHSPAPSSPNHLPSPHPHQQHHHSNHHHAHHHQRHSPTVHVRSNTNTNTGGTSLINHKSGLLSNQKQRRLSIELSQNTQLNQNDTNKLAPVSTLLARKQNPNQQLHQQQQLPDSTTPTPSINSNMPKVGSILQNALLQMSNKTSTNGDLLSQQTNNTNNNSQHQQQRLQQKLQFGYKTNSLDISGRFYTILHSIQIINNTFNITLRSSI